MHVTHNAGADILINPSPGGARRSSSSNRKGPPLGEKNSVYIAGTLHILCITPIQINWFTFYFLHFLHNAPPSHPRPSKQSPRFPPRAAIIPPRPAITLIPLLSLD
jgi:hypothetical protein